MAIQNTEDDRSLLADLFDRMNAPAGAREKADRLIDRFGSLRGVLEASPLSLEDCGLSEVEAALLFALPAVARRRALAPFERMTAVASGAEADLVRALFTGVTAERTALIILDGQRRLLGTPVLAEGTSASVSVDMRALLGRVLDCGGQEVILCHNHPRGGDSFSQTDLDATRSVQAGLKALGVKLSDHLLSVGRKVVSMKKMGLMKFT